MARSYPDPATAIPQADLLEQRTPIAPDPLSSDLEPPTADPPAANEADLLDQLITLLTDDEEEYPNAHASGAPDARPSGRQGPTTSPRVSVCAASRCGLARARLPRPHRRRVRAVKVKAGAASSEAASVHTLSV